MIKIPTSPLLPIARESSASRLFSGSDFPAEYDVSKRMNKSKDLKVDYRKMLAAMVYAQAVLWLTSYTMVVVHDRVPDVEKYPPLPDLVLDNVPYIPWAFQVLSLVYRQCLNCANYAITIVSTENKYRGGTSDATNSSSPNVSLITMSFDDLLPLKTAIFVNRK